jgi:hypothetical protein
MAGCLACDGGNPRVPGRDFHASVTGDRVVDRQGLQPSLPALQPWVAGHRGFVVVEARLRCPGNEASMAGQRGFDGRQGCDAGRQGSYQVRGPRVSMPLTETIRPDPACRGARPSRLGTVMFIVSVSDLRSVEE